MANDAHPNNEFLKLVESLETAESSLRAAKKWAQKVGKDLGVSTNSLENMAQESRIADETQDGKIIEGVFDGSNMIDGEGSVYPVPANYASKSKLVEGDRLKLTIAENGAFIYKQIELVDRKLLVGHLVLDGSQYQVLVDNQIFNVLYASVTYYRAQVGDQVTIIVPAEGVAQNAAIENIIPQAVVEAKAQEVAA